MAVRLDNPCRHRNTTPHGCWCWVDTNYTKVLISVDASILWDGIKSEDAAPRWELLLRERLANCCPLAVLPRTTKVSSLLFLFQSLHLHRAIIKLTVRQEMYPESLQKKVYFLVEKVLMNLNICFHQIHKKCNFFKCIQDFWVFFSYLEMVGRVLTKLDPMRKYILTNTDI